ncbi:MAG: FHA domain-containing protein [Chloroflexi bacterium]|nr:FHA domain-containing protein [Chloroflexota bacterium]
MTLTNKLIMKSGPEVGKVIQLEKDELLIGRELINDLIISDPEISRKHARIFTKNKKLYLEDLGSTNGTFQSGKKITKPVELKNGDLLTLGKGVVLEFISETVEEHPAVELPSDEKKQEGTKQVRKTPQVKEKQIKPAGTKTADKQPKSSTKSDAPLGIEKLRNTPTWVIVLVIVLLFLLVFCVLPMLIIEWTDQWCNFFGAFFNQIQPGVCP